ncbi:MAG: cohesin domain-containing protein, partial [Bacteroidales bacterium]
MKRLFLIILSICIGMTTMAQTGSVTLRLGSDSGIPGSEVVIAFTAEDFTDILSMQGTIEFDASQLSFIETEQYGLPDMSSSSFGTSQTGSGYLTFSWYDSGLSGQSLPDGSTLFAMRFEVTGTAGNSTPVLLSDAVTPVEVVDDSYTELTVFDQTGQVNILEDPQPGDELTIEIADDSVQNGDEILVPVKASHFSDMLGIQGSINWDPAVLDFVNTETYNLPDMNSGNFGTSNTASGILTFSWNDADFSGESLSDGETIFALRFEALGSNGTQTDVSLDNSPTQTEFTDTSYNPVDFTHIPETIFITNTSISDSLVIHADSVEDAIGAQVQVAVRADGFQDIMAMQGSISFDPAIASFDTISQYGLDDMAYSNFGTDNAGSGNISFSWNDPNLTGLSLADDSALFVMQFTLVGNIGDISPVEFINTPTEFEFIDVNYNEVETGLISGQIEIIDLYELEITNLSGSEFCAGESFTIDYQATGDFLTENVFTAELSDASGSFASPTIIGSLASNNSGSITATLPANLSDGSAYKIRLQASHPVYTSDIWTTDLTIHALPTADAGADTDICDGSSTTLSATGGVDYLWSTSETTADISVSPAADAEYSVTVTDAFGCENADTVQVTVNPLPTADAGADQDICLGETAGITATGGVDYAWSHGAITASDNVTPSSDTEYIVTVTDANGCSDSDSVMINVFSVTADAGADQEICMGETATLSASGGSSYAWSTGDNTQDINVSPTADTEYYVTVTGVNSCTDEDTVQVTVHPLPTADAGADTDICDGSSTT